MNTATLIFRGLYGILAIVAIVIGWGILLITIGVFLGAVLGFL